MKSSPGIAAKMFRTLADEDVNIEMISTSTIRISVVIAGADLERAARSLHTAFGLDTGERLRRAAPRASLTSRRSTLAAGSTRGGMRHEATWSASTDPRPQRTAAGARRRAGRGRPAASVHVVCAFSRRDGLDVPGRLGLVRRLQPDDRRADRRAAGGDVPRPGHRGDVGRRRREAGATRCSTEAERLEADVIVVGNRRMQGVSRLLGSVANEVAHNAPCDVLIVKTVMASLARSRSTRRVALRLAAPAFGPTGDLTRHAHCGRGRAVAPLAVDVPTARRDPTGQVERGPEARSRQLARHRRVSASSSERGARSGRRRSGGRCRGRRSRACRTAARGGGPARTGRGAACARTA